MGHDAQWGWQWGTGRHEDDDGLSVPWGTMGQSAQWGWPRGTTRHGSSTTGSTTLSTLQMGPQSPPHGWTHAHHVSQVDHRLGEVAGEHHGSAEL